MRVKQPRTRGKDYSAYKQASPLPHQCTLLVSIKECIFSAGAVNIRTGAVIPQPKLSYWSGAELSHQNGTEQTCWSACSAAVTQGLPCPGHLSQAVLQPCCAVAQLCCITIELYHSWLFHSLAFPQLSNIKVELFALNKVFPPLLHPQIGDSCCWWVGKNELQLTKAWLVNVLGAAWQQLKVSLSLS